MAGDINNKVPAKSLVFMVLRPELSLSETNVFSRPRRPRLISSLKGVPFRGCSQATRPGLSIEAIGPRGKIALVDDAEWHLFAGDATAVPGALAMMETLADDVPAHAFLLVDGPEERQPITGDGARRSIAWRYELSQPPESSGLVAAVAAAGLPGGRGHAYLAGEVALVSALKAALMNRGWDADQISAKAYWNRGRANAGHGEPELKAS